jgi:hypothetical protein
MTQSVTRNIVLVHGVNGSHAIYVSQPNAVAALIKQAAQGASAATAAS